MSEQRLQGGSNGDGRIYINKCRNVRTPQLRVSKSGPGAPDCSPNRSPFLRRMRFVAGRGAVAELLLAEDTVTELLLAGALLQDSIGKRLLQKRQLWLVRQIIHIFAGGRVGEEHLRAER